MDPHVIILDGKRDQEFLKQQRKDPVIKVLLEPGNHVVVCAHCRSVFLEDTWAEIKGRFEHGLDTLPELPVDPLSFSRAPSFTDRAATQSAESAQDPPNATPPLATESPSAAPPPVNHPYQWSQERQQRANGDHQPSNENRERAETPEPPRDTRQRRPLVEPRQPSNGRRRRWPWNPPQQPVNGATQRDSGLLTLKEIPFVLREIPFRLRETRY